MFNMNVSSDKYAQVLTVKPVTDDKIGEIETESRIVATNRLKCADFDR